MYINFTTTFNYSDPRYTSELNYMRFYLPDIFPTLNKILFFDHDVVVQQDLSGLWNANLKGKVIAAVGTCQEGGTSCHRMDMLINFSDPFIAERFDANACTWAFGMNLFDLQQWRRHNLTALYHRYLQMVWSKKCLYFVGTLLFSLFRDCFLFPSQKIFLLLNFFKSSVWLLALIN